jgi:hypothetical protein
MKLRAACVVVSFLSLLLSPVPRTVAQTTAENTSALPRLVRFGGTVKDVNGNPLTGVVGVTFALYSEETGGTSLWLETQNVTADSKGHFVALLGSTKPEGLPTDVFTTEQAHWVGVQVSGQAEQPRVLLVSTPYALKAGDAETIGGLPPSAFVLANHETATGAKGGGAPAPAGAQKNSAPPSNPDVTGKGTLDYIPMWDTTSDIVDSIIFQKSSEIGIATTTPAATLDVNGTTDIRNTLTLYPNGANNTLAVHGTSFTVASTGSVSAATVVASSSTAGEVVVAGSNTAATGRSIGVYGTAESASGYGVVGLNTGLGGASIGVYGQSYSFSGVGVAGFASNVNENGVGVEGRTASPRGSGVYGVAISDTATGVIGSNTAKAGESAGVYGLSASSSGTGVHGVNSDTTGTGSGGDGVTGETSSPNGSGVAGIATATTGSELSYGVYGQDAGVNGDGVGGNFTGINGSGVYGFATTNGSGFSEGAAGVNFSTTGPSNGVFGSTASPDGVGGLFENTGAGLILLGRVNQDFNLFTVDGFGDGGFAGNLTVTGAIFAGTKDFKIDHPLDPANKYLYHASVESSEMMNIYTGNITTDGDGVATVQLPQWFEALNRDFRYQLTVIGQFAQAIVADEVANHHFRIRTDKPNVKVSWQVTGVRQDAFANAHPLRVEEEKASYDRGHYLHPELYGAPKSASINYTVGTQVIEHNLPLIPRPVKAVQAQARLPRPIIPPARPFPVLPK